VRMNPVLLKPEADTRSQVVLLGQVSREITDLPWRERKAHLWPHVQGALHSLLDEFDVVVIEGAGSPAEVNLRASDIVNMRVALHAGAAVLLVGDIDRGGVFAHLLGTMELLTPEERACVRGFVINRFRGDPTLLAPAIEDLERRTGVPVLGVVPWLTDLRVAQEDAVALERAGRTERGGEEGTGTVDIAVARLPRIANFDDFDPLAAEPGVRVRYVARPEDIGEPALISLPGTKATVADLEALRASGLADAVVERAAHGSHVLGICGGYQMLGRSIADPAGVEGPATTVPGLGWLDVETVLEGDKVLVETEGVSVDGAVPFKGYEMHVGRTTGATGSLLVLSSGQRDGAVDATGRIAGCYIHGLLADDRMRRYWLERIGAEASDLRYEPEVDATLDKLADHLEAHVDCDALLALARAPRLSAR